MDASIILQGRGAQINDPMDVAIKGMNMRQLANSNLAAEKKLGQDTALNEAMKNNTAMGPDGKMTMNNQAVVNELYQKDPQQAMAVQKQFEGHDLEKLTNDTKAMQMLFSSATPETGPALKAQAIKLGITNADKLPDQWTPETIKGIQNRTLEMKDQIANQLNQQKFDFQKKEHGDKMSLEYAKLTDKNNTDKKLGNKTQFDAAGFGRRIEQSEAIFDKLSKAGYDRTDLSSAVGALGIFPNKFRGGEGIEQDQAERNFINATLRRESGAAISPSEFTSAEAQYLPRTGDTPQVLANKLANRQQVMESLKAEAGPSWEKVPLVVAKDVKTEKPSINFDLDVINYATQHKITPEAANAIKMERTGKAAGN